jgi:hypothetical protein
MAAALNIIVTEGTFGEKGGKGKGYLGQSIPGRPIQYYI